MEASGVRATVNVKAPGSSSTIRAPLGWKRFRDPLEVEHSDSVVHRPAEGSVVPVIWVRTSVAVAKKPIGADLVVIGSRLSHFRRRCTNRDRVLEHLRLEDPVLTDARHGCPIKRERCQFSYATARFPPSDTLSTSQRQQPVQPVSTPCPPERLYLASSALPKRRIPLQLPSPCS